MTSVRGVDAAQVSALAPAVRGALSRAGAPAQEIPDLTQETLTRLLEVRGRLDSTTVEQYAIRVALNLLTARRRKEDIERRNLPRLTAPATVEDASEPVIRGESIAAVRLALEAIPPESRPEIVVDETTPKTTLSSAEASRRQRARARFRLEYLLALRRQRVPPACHAVLMSISSRDSRQQQRLNTDEHLQQCPRCRALAGPLERRHRRLFGLVFPIGATLELARWIRQHPGRSAATLALATGVTTAALVVAFPPAKSSPTSLSSSSLAAPTTTAPAAGASASSALAEQMAIRPVLFDTGSASLDQTAQDAVEQAASILRDQHVAAVKVIGHTDATGNEQANQLLGGQRAQAVAQMLSTLVPGLRIDVTTVGDSQPLMPNDTEAHRQANRRATIETES